MAVPRLARPLVLSGFMATGKSTVGRLVAARLGVPFLDTDALLEAQTGKTVGELFASEGEARFREREAALVLGMLEDRTPRVIAFGGGTVTMPRVRHAALEAATVLTLTASAETIVARVPSLPARPNLLAASPLDRARDLLTLRREAYGECHAAIPTEGRTPEALAEVVLGYASRDALAMPLGTRTYAVELADGEPERLAAALAELSPSSLLVVTDTNVVQARGAWLTAALGGITAARRDVVITPGEPSKTLATVARIWDEALTGGVDRDAVVIAFGGGVVGDLAGFAASTLLRGVRCVQVATSLLAMVDSSVGGKTGFDHAAGKNLIGAFFQPSRVILDVEHLTTLPPRERTAGLAEVVKVALVQDAALLAALERDAEALARGDRAALRPIIRAAVEAKLRVVRDDERESGARALLNLGHTVGHALEAHGGYATLLHGEAVAIGTVLELRATERLGLTPAGTATRAAALMTRLGLPTDASPREVAAAWPFVMSDKKRAATTLKLPVVTGAGRGSVERIPLADLNEALVGAKSAP
jgi:shikimate kinase/3-dehydroquinate synthase